MISTDPAAAPASVPDQLAASHRLADRYGFIEAARTAGPRVCLRFATWNTSGTRRGTAVVLAGRGEFIEKYATELMGELLDRGFDVQAMDWRGQGLSDRSLPDRHKGHIDDFATYVADLKLFLDRVVAPQASGPVICISHSMGGHTVLRYLAEHGNGPLAAALMTAPMNGLVRESILRIALALLPERPSIETRYLYGSGPFTLIGREFAINRLTHDERRFRFTDQWFAADPRLTLGGPTTGWARQAMRSMTLARQRGYLERIELPVMVLSAGQDRLVDRATHPLTVARLKRGELVMLPDSRHEIMMETDAIRGRFWEAFDRLAKSLGV